MQGELGQWPERAQVDCSQALVVLHDYLDGELSVERREHVRFHLDACSHCGGAFDFEMELKMIVRARVRDAAPDMLRQRVVEALMVEQQRRLLHRERRVSPPDPE